MNKSFVYRIYPNASQQELMQKTFGCCRWVYNKVLFMRKEEYAATKKSKSIISYINLLPKWKKSEAPWLSEVDSVALQQSLRNLDRAYKNFFRNPGKIGFPKFKSKHRGRKTYRTVKIDIVDSKHIKLPKLGLVKARVDRPTEGRILSATVKQVPSGKYYVTICCTDVPKAQIPKGPVKVMGIDAGVHDLMTRSDGVKVANPKSLAKMEKKLSREQRKLSRKQKGSANRAKQRRKVALVHEKIANRRKDAIHKATIDAVRESQAIAVESPNVSGMLRNHCLAKAVSDASMSMMLGQLEYKCSWYGRDFVKIDRYYPSSKMCWHCGVVFDDLTLAMREWDCPECGAHHDRDLNMLLSTSLAKEREF